MAGGGAAFFDDDFEYGSVEDLLENEDSSRDQDIGSVIELLEDQERREKQRLQCEKESVEGVLEDRKSIYKDVIEELDEEIRVQGGKLKSAAVLRMMIGRLGSVIGCVNCIGSVGRGFVVIGVIVSRGWSGAGVGASAG